MQTFLATSVATVIEAALGAWAAVLAIVGSIVGFAALAAGSHVDEVVRDAAIGAVAATPSGCLVAVGTVLLEVLS